MKRFFQPPFVLNGRVLIETNAAEKSPQATGFNYCTDATSGIVVLQTYSTTRDNVRTVYGFIMLHAKSLELASRKVGCYRGAVERNGSRSIVGQRMTR